MNSQSCITDSIIELLWRHYPAAVPVEKLSGQMHIGARELLTHLEALRGDGLPVGYTDNDCVGFTSRPDRLLPVLIQAGLKTDIVAGEIHYYESVGSTNHIAKELVQQGVPDGTIIVAEEQTQGRGRLDRQWISPAYSNILCSVILFPDVPESCAFRVTMLVSIAAARAIGTVCGLPAMIKWPNDIFIRNRKVCGILSEIQTEGGAVRSVVAGVGMNVNFDTGACREICDTATSLKQECGHAVSRLDVLCSLCGEIDALYRASALKDGGILQSEWERLSLVHNREVMISSGDQTICGRVAGINAYGNLLLIDDGGREQVIVAGDVSLRTV